MYAQRYPRYGPRLRDVPFPLSVSIFHVSHWPAEPAALWMGFVWWTSRAQQGNVTYSCQYSSPGTPTVPGAILPRCAVWSQSHFWAVRGQWLSFLAKPTHWCQKAKTKHDVPMTGRIWQGKVEVDRRSSADNSKSPFPCSSTASQSDHWWWESWSQPRSQTEKKDPCSFTRRSNLRNSPSADHRAPAHSIN